MKSRPSVANFRSSFLYILYPRSTLLTGRRPRAEEPNCYSEEAGCASRAGVCRRFSEGQAESHSLGLLRPETGDPTMLSLRELRIWAVRPGMVSQLSALGIRGRHGKACGKGVGAPSFETGTIHLFFPVGLLRQFLMLTALWPLFATIVVRSVAPFQHLDNVAMVAET